MGSCRILHDTHLSWPIGWEPVRIISKSRDFLFGTTTTPSITFSNSHFFRSESARRFLFNCAVSLAWSQKAYYTIVQFPLVFLLRMTLASRGNSASKNLPCNAQRPNCCLYEMPYYVAAPIRETGDVIAHLQEPEFVFGSQVMRFSKDPSYSSTGSYVPCFWGSHLQRQYHQRTTYAHETLIVTWRYDLPQDWLWDACHQAGVRWVSRCEGFRSKEGLHYCLMQSARNLTINLDSRVGNPLRIPFPSCTV